MQSQQQRQRLVILGAAGRDFHNFNQLYRDNPAYEVVAFTAAQIAGIADRRYPRNLAGTLYPQGIAIVAEGQLEQICREENIDQVVFAYSDVSHEQVMHLASRVLAGGADFILLGPEKTYLTSPIPVIAVSAVRTGCGKSQTVRWIAKILRQRGLQVGVIRHPMPYGDLEKQAVQCFSCREDLEQAHCTIEEREEYEPHLALGNRVYAGVDYGAIVAKAAQENELLLWDGGNNDFPFIRPDLHLVLVDPLRVGDETHYHPGEAVLRMADIVIIPKVGVATPQAVQTLRETIRRLNPPAQIIRGRSPLQLEQAELVAGKKVLVIEDGPTTTHGGMAYGAGYVAAQQAGVAEIVDPRPYAAPEIAAIYEAYPHLEAVLPAMGYFPAQLQALAATINAVEADFVVAATPIDLGALMELNKPLLRVSYEFAEADHPGLAESLAHFLKRFGF
jgi:predicted GTPase